MLIRLSYYQKTNILIWTRINNRQRRAGETSTQSNRIVLHKLHGVSIARTCIVILYWRVCLPQGPSFTTNFSVHLSQLVPLPNLPVRQTQYSAHLQPPEMISANHNGEMNISPLKHDITLSFTRYAVVQLYNHNWQTINVTRSWTIVHRLLPARCTFSASDVNQKD